MTFRCTQHDNAKKKVIPSPTGGEGLEVCDQCHEEGKKLIEREEAARPGEDKKAAAEQKQRAIDNALGNAAIAPRFKDRTFDTYVIENDGQQEAVRQCRWLLDNLNVTGLIFLGNRGTGKDHLAVSTIKEAVVKGKTALMTEAIKIIRAIKMSWIRDGGEGEDKIIQRYTEPDLLIINELGVQHCTETERMYLTEIINDRYNHRRATILVGNLDMKELEVVVGQRAIDRFREDGHTVSFDWKSYRQKP